MQPIFPRRNWAINSLIEFRQGGVIYDFCKYFEEPGDGWEKEHLEFKVSHLFELFQGLKEELNQTIHTSNKITITTYFEELKQIISSWNLNNVDSDEILQEVKDWNEKKYNDFLEEIEKKSTEYFNKPERTKYAHLEEYENTFYSPFSMGLQTTKVINKNFFCIEDKPKLIDIQYLDKYLKILKRVTDEFNSSISKELKLYDEGKIISDINAEKSFYEKTMEKIKNNKIIAGILIGFLIYGGISETIKYTKENRENLFGNDGLLNQKKKDSTTLNKNSQSESENIQDSTININEEKLPTTLYKHNSGDSAETKISEQTQVKAKPKK